MHFSLPEQKKSKGLGNFIMLEERISNACVSVTHEMLSNLCHSCANGVSVAIKKWFLN